MPKYGNSAPGRQKWNFSKFFHFCGKVSRFRFQRALNHPQTLTLSQVMQENVIMPKYGNSAPGSQKWNFSKKVHSFKKSLQISLPTSPQPPPDIKFKSSCNNYILHFVAVFLTLRYPSYKEKKRSAVFTAYILISYT